MFKYSPILRYRRLGPQQTSCGVHNLALRSSLLRSCFPLQLSSFFLPLSFSFLEKRRALNRTCPPWETPALRQGLFPAPGSVYRATSRDALHCWAHGQVSAARRNIKGIDALGWVLALSLLFRCQGLVKLYSRCAVLELWGYWGLITNM